VYPPGLDFHHENTYRRLRNTVYGAGAPPEPGHRRGGRVRRWLQAAVTEDLQVFPRVTAGLGYTVL